MMHWYLSGWSWSVASTIILQLLSWWATLTPTGSLGERFRFAWNQLVSSVIQLSMIDALFSHQPLMTL
eukprot:5469655-Amphidinium_carterae.1